MNSGTQSVAFFFAAVMLLSIPFWILGEASNIRLFPGVPGSAFMFVVPGIVAFLLVIRGSENESTLEWLRQTLGLSELKRLRWLFIAIAVPPAMLLVTSLLMQFYGQHLPDTQIAPTRAALLLLLFLVPALFEELGWSGFALVRLQQHMGALGASLIIGCVWAAWHFIPLLQANRSPEWIAWWCLTAISLRILISWVFNSSASVVIAAVFHASENAAWQLFPYQGSHYDPKYHALVLMLTAIAMVSINGSATLTRRPVQSRPRRRK